LLSVLNQSTDSHDRLETLQVLARMRYVPALPAIADSLAKGQWPEWVPVYLYGQMGDTAVPFLLSRIDDNNPHLRHNAVLVLGQWLIPPEAAPAFEQRYWKEPDPEIRRLLIAGLKDLVSDFEKQHSLAETILATEQDQETNRLAREWRDGIVTMGQTVAAAKAKKKQSSVVLDEEIQAYLRSEFLDFEAVLNASTVADEPRLKEIRAEKLAGAGPQNYGHVARLNRIILINRAASAQK
jgi:hypothetical protein